MADSNARAAKDISAASTTQQAGRLSETKFQRLQQEKILGGKEVFVLFGSHVHDLLVE